jgi:hypothetical protein
LIDSFVELIRRACDEGLRYCTWAQKSMPSRSHCTGHDSVQGAVPVTGAGQHLVKEPTELDRTPGTRVTANPGGDQQRCRSAGCT